MKFKERIAVKPSVEVLFKLCKILDESADYLLGLED